MGLLALERLTRVAAEAAAPVAEGKLASVLGLVMEMRGCRAEIGDVFELVPQGEAAPIEAEVVGLKGDSTLLMPLGTIEGLAVGDRARRVSRGASVGVGPELLGRVIDGMGRPLDGGPMPATSSTRGLRTTPANPLLRRPIQEPLTVGVRAIDGILTLGKGQRLGIFAGGGVGKSTVLGMMVRRAKVDVAVIALIGERGREVEEFVRLTLGEEGLARSVVVAATSSDPPLVRARGALLATSIAEHFRDEGRDVLLVMDSVTRYAMALREVGLAAGEPPTTKGYTPSVFAALPHLLERAGTHVGKGSITGIYTVLVEGDDLSDPVADAARAILDGHVVLARKLAEKGHFPAIDVPSSVSRCMPQVAPRERISHARRVRTLLAAHREAEDLLSVGAYRAGTVPELDESLARLPKLNAFLREGLDDEEDGRSVDAHLAAIFD